MWKSYNIFSSNLRSKCLFILLIATTLVNGVPEGPTSTDELKIGDCRLVLNGTCPDPDIQFFLYSKENPTEGQMITLNNGTQNLTLSNFKPKLKSKIIIHGFNTGMHMQELDGIRKEYLQNNDSNIQVFVVNWPSLARTPCYAVAVHNTRFAGKCVAQLVEALIHEGATDIHILGFSLGAHVAGFVADNLQPYKLPRITGLDPASPLFESCNPDDKLDANDAELVDVIHTNAHLNGKVEPCGDVDFYVNGGTEQPGCKNKSNCDDIQTCNHRRAAAYFAESINSEKGFHAWRCENFTALTMDICPPTEPLVVMGEQVPVGTSGIYQVKTSSEEPFAMGGPNVSSSTSAQNLQLKSPDNTTTTSSSSTTTISVGIITLLFLSQLRYVIYLLH